MNQNTPQTSDTSFKKPMGGSSRNNRPTRITYCIGANTDGQKTRDQQENECRSRVV